MNGDRDLLKDVEFIEKLKANELITPNEFTVEMGKFIRKAREDAGLSQAEFAKKTNRRPATISEIKNGKSEIGVLTLALFAITLQKPISYFFPKSLLKKFVLDVKLPFEQEMLEIARGIDAFGDQLLTMDLLKFLSSHFEEEKYAALKGYQTEEE
jgi:transcriptional regulator with XRE-family HTH domain